MEDRRLGFSMIELVMVIVVLGILSALAIPRLKSDVRSGAMDNIYSALQFTRHLALIDNRTDPTDANWQQELWTIAFASYEDDDGNREYTYSICSNKDHNGAFKKLECAIDPANGKYFYNRNSDKEIDIDESPNVFLGKNFGVKDIIFSGGCSKKYLAFDNLGRPFIDGIYTKKAFYSGVMVRDCKITVKFEDTDIEDIEFSIKKETGFVEIVK